METKRMGGKNKGGMSKSQCDLISGPLNQVTRFLFMG